MHSNFTEAIERALNTLSEREQEVLRLRFGLADGMVLTPADIGRKFAVSTRVINNIVSIALRKLRHPTRLRMFEDALDEHAPHADKPESASNIVVTDLVEAEKTLTPYLIQHLKSHNDDLQKIPWNIFEHLIAEFFASWGFSEVRLVGKDHNTASDIFALRKDDPTGVDLKYYVEVKRWKRKVGVEVIDRVYGAFINEKPKYGWHVGMIVSSVGFTNTKKFSREEWSKRGIELRDKSDVLEWLLSYKPNKNGLWLPDPEKSIIKT